MAKRNNYKAIMEQNDPTSQETPLLGSQRTSPSTESLTARRASSQERHEERGQDTAAAVAPLHTESVHSHPNDSEDDGELRSRQLTLSRLSRRLQSTVAHILVDEQGTGWPVVFGLLSLLVIGCILGAILPKDKNLPTAWYRFISSAIGYTYFMCWSVSFYPQLLSNYRRKSTLGLSPDFCGLNVLGFACYATYNVTMFWSSTIEKEYKGRYGENASISVQSNDVAFAIHAFCLASLTLFQIGYYNGFQGTQMPSKVNMGIIAAVIAAAIIFPVLVLTVEKIQWLDYLYMLSYVKVVISIIKYVPQVILNYQRQSTVGWSIWNIILDFSGGMLSDLQLVLDCAAMGDWSGITGNLAKFGLGSVSIIFDLLFMAQHYILYPHTDATQRVSPTDEEQQHGSGNTMAAIDECNL